MFARCLALATLLAAVTAGTAPAQMKPSLPTEIGTGATGVMTQTPNQAQQGAATAGEQRAAEQLQKEKDKTTPKK